MADHRIACCYWLLFGEVILVTPEMMECYLALAKKEALLGELIAWLRAKGLYEEAMRDCPSGIE